MKSLLRRVLPIPQRRWWPQVPLLWVLVVPFVVQVAASVGGVAYLSYRGAQRDLEAVAEQLRAQAAQRIHADLDQRLQQQQRALTLAYELLQQNQWPVDDEARVRQLLWQHMQLMPSLTTVGMATEQGLEVAYGRLMNADAVAQAERTTGRSLLLNTPFLIHRSPLQRTERYFSLVDGQGQPQELVYSQVLPVNEMIWYQTARSLNRQGWSPIFSTHATSELTINALMPLRDVEGQFEGALSTFLRLSEISAFLAKLEFSPTGESFIFERSGALVASSVAALPYKPRANGSVQRIYIQESDHPWLRATAQHLLQDYGNFDHLPDHSHATLRVNGDLLYVDVQAYRDDYGLDWVVVVALPNADLMPNVQASQRHLLWLWGGTLLLSTGLGWLTARLIMAPLRRLTKASQALAAGGKDPLADPLANPLTNPLTNSTANPLAEPTAIAELAHLAQTFNQMAHTIQTSQTELKQSLADLQTSEYRFRQLFQADVVGIMVADLEGHILDANDYFLNLVGYTRQDLVAGRLCWDTLTPPEHRVQDQRLVEELRHRGWFSAHEKAYYHREGYPVPVLMGGVMVGEDQVVCVEVDLRARKQAEQALRESEAFLQHIAAASPSILYIYDVQEQRNRYVIGAVKDILGYSSEEILAMESDFFPRLFPAEQLAQLNQDYVQISTLVDGEIRSNELVMQTASGDQRWVFNRYTVFSRDASGQVKCTLGSVQDITVLKQAEAETERWKDRLEFILAASPAAIFTCNLDYTVTFISQNIEGMVGYGPGEIIGWEGFWAEHIHPDDADRVVGEMGALFQQGRSTHEYRWKHRQGYYRWMLNELSLVRDDQGQPQELVGYCIDISDRKQAEAQLQQTNEDLLRATRLKDEFLAAMSHELRTPLTAILGMTEGLLEEVFGPITPAQAKALDTVDHSGSHLLQLINDILDVSKLEAGQMTLALTGPIDVVALCQTSLSFVEPQARAKAIQITTQRPDTLPQVTLDERRIRQVLINLLSNAVKFTPNGGMVTLSASVQPPATEADPAYLCLSVQDTGIGIAAADQERIFEPFLQLDSALNRKYEGTGLGLGLVKRLVAIHGGHLTLTSTPGQGSCFSVYLPYTDSLPAP